MRKSSQLNVVFWSMAPDKKPLPKGLNGTKPIPSRCIDVDAKLGGDDTVVADRLQGLADNRFVGEGSNDFSSIKEGDAPLKSRSNQRNRVCGRQGLDVRLTDPHAAKANGGNVKAAAAKLALPHCDHPCGEADRQA